MSNMKDLREKFTKRVIELIHGLPYEEVIKKEDEKMLWGIDMEPFPITIGRVIQVLEKEVSSSFHYFKWDELPQGDDVIGEDIGWYIMSNGFWIKWKLIKELPKTPGQMGYVYKCYIDKGAYNISVVTIGYKHGVIANDPVYIMVVSIIQPDISKGTNEAASISSGLTMLFTGYKTPQAVKFANGIFSAYEKLGKDLKSVDDMIKGKKQFSTVFSGLTAFVIPPYEVGIVAYAQVRPDDVGSASSLFYTICPMTMTSILKQLDATDYTSKEELKRRGIGFSLPTETNNNEKVNTLAGTILKSQILDVKFDKWYGWTESKTKEWIKKYNYKSENVIETEEQWIFKQRNSKGGRTICAAIDGWEGGEPGLYVVIEKNSNNE